MDNMQVMQVIISPNDFQINQIIEDLRQRTKGKAGACVVFVGYVRDYADNAKPASLFLDHYPAMAQKQLEKIGHQAQQQWQLLDYTIVHRVGKLDYEEQIVCVATASTHRHEAFQACEFIMDTLKTRAPFWKKEILANGQEFWVEQKETDNQKTLQWLSK